LLLFFFFYSSSILLITSKSNFPNLIERSWCQPKKRFRKAGMFTKYGFPNYYNVEKILLKVFDS
jgi:hypothetical protein